MDFSYSEDQEAVSVLAERIVGDFATHERLRALESDPDGLRVDRDLWTALAEAGLVGIGLAEDVGGGGRGLSEVAVVAETVGRHAAPVPVVETMAAAAPAVDVFGAPAARDRWLPGVVAGTTVVTTALAEPGGSPTHPAVRAVADGDGWVLDGATSCVPWGLVAHGALVPARADDGVEVFVLDLAAPGVVRTRQDTTSGRPEAHLALDGVRLGAGDVLGRKGTRRATGTEVVEWLLLRTKAALAVTEAGVAAAALALLAAYTSQREQFGKAIATFQAVGQRAADAYVDAEAVRLSAWQAVWRLDAGLPADDAVDVATYWAAEGGQRVVHAATHLHGGVGVDRDYPLHRFFLLTRHLELTLGGATEHLVRIGTRLAETPA
jgi:alkylation response protein AidB-like acyl-CoA dehydrogenase